MPLSMLLGGVAAAVVGLLVGLPALRLKGDYLAIVTLACGEIIKTIINNLSVTGGAKGLDTSDIYADTRTLLPFAIVLIFLVVLVMMNLKNSRHGRPSWPSGITVSQRSPTCQRDVLQADGVRAGGFLRRNGRCAVRSYAGQHQARHV